MPDEALDFEDTAELDPSPRIVGQDIALRAIRQAVEMESPGYNLFVTGLDSGGRLRTAQRILADLAPRRRQRRDFAYVHDFDDPSRPRLLILPAGAAPRFSRELQDLADLLFDEVPRILQSEPVRKRRDGLYHELERKQREALAGLQRELEEEGFVLVDQGEGDEVEPTVMLLVDEEPHPRAELGILERDGKLDRPAAEIEARFDVLEDRLAETLVRARAAVLEVSREVREVERVAVGAGLADTFRDLGRRFPRARRWLEALHAHIADHHEVFRSGGRDEAPPEALLPLQVNVLHRGARGRKAPIVAVPDPTYGNLFGGIAQEPPGGAPANHTHLRAGALHDADGGYLVLNAADLLMEPGAWKTLKRAMLYGKLGLQNLEGAIQGAAAALRPEPMPLDVKVVLLGDDALFALLYATDPDFPSIFKIKAEFEPTVDYRPELPRQVGEVLARLARREGFRPLHRGAVAAIVEWAVRTSGRGGRVRLAFGEMADLAREADYLARGERVTREDVAAALAAREERHGHFARRTRDALKRDILHVATEGAVIGQINALAVYHAGGHEWGRPLRVTASVGTGRGGVVNIEREARLSGRVHDKGVQVLTGFLRGRFGRRRTLALTASIAVEQHYGRIDGDSASSAELYALLSAIARVPLRQDRAVTGSVDQFGTIQPIGGVNEKVEGFFRLCADRGLSGEQGVLIPTRNVEDLCLAEDVVAACREGRFHVWPVATVEEGLRLLTGVEPGEAEAETWPEDTIYGRVLAALADLEQVVRRATRGEKNGGNGSAEESDAKKPAAGRKKAPAKRKKAPAGKA